MTQRSKFVCKVCGYQSLKWEGRCPECGEWDSLVEEMNLPKKTFSVESAPPQLVTEIKVSPENRYLTKINEFDRILGGGIVPGSVVLVGGEPGIGKSTLLMEVANSLSYLEFPVLYVSGEESLQQTKLRAHRLNIKSPFLYVLAENNLEIIEKEIQKINPKVAILDSIQTVYLNEMESSPGTVSQVRECASYLTRIAKNNQISIFLVGHVTKEGYIAGPRIMEHIVDTVLYFEASKDYQFRILRATKNRFGPTSEIGVFKMSESGLEEVVDPSAIFISSYQLNSQVSGKAIVPVVEGTRAFLVEIQALVCRSNLTIPRRVTQGVDYNRVCLLLAVLEKGENLNFYQKDVYINATGGVRVEEPACDLGISLAVVSSLKEKPVTPKTVIVGEVGLGGEIRPVGLMESRLKEAKKLGFTRCLGCVLEEKEAKKVKGMEFIGVSNIKEAIQRGLKVR